MISYIEDEKMDRYCWDYSMATFIDGTAKETSDKMLVSVLLTSKGVRRLKLRINREVQFT